MTTPDNSQEPAGDSAGVVIPEDFQQQVHKLVHKATKHQLAHVRDRVYAREDEMRKEEMAKANSKGGAKGKNSPKATVPDSYSTEGMPA